ncbi:hypothetical protein BCV69DRAFT_283611 [Microstroma glucosiphilum]|uniref:RNase H type-1 domain-containing protein n=1 Tax=Pseudomicrostroma glucosiphilum TaxID=1684307 RepID=A0A316U5G6_9BASI|nr:hypothetical protein BCV69DRAFT_283611 [Pseudomicrostroma glucosiphilum]PWN20078.1 hypothetical protein BCV69DRAFT_283611 [Pseudomicrostroma glucosiphilum]
MSAADPRYYQLWAASAPKTPAASSSSSTDRPYRVDLDAPGGVTYAPSELATHNAKRRLFIPRKGAVDDEYDFGYEIAQRMRSQRAAESSDDRATVTEQPFTIGDDTSAEAESHQGGEAAHHNNQPQSDAQLYAQSVALGSSSKDASRPVVSFAETVTEETPSESSSAAQDGYSMAPSDTRSYRSTTTAADIARKQGLFQQPTMVRDGAAIVSTFRPPPSISGDTTRSVDPWNVTALHGRREFERLTEEEREKGLTKFEEISGEGNAPSLEEVNTNAERDAPRFSDAATIRTARSTATTIGGAEGLRVRDLFIPDPRPYKPLRLVRRSDPRQMLVLASGVALSHKELQQVKLMEAAAAAGATKDLWKEEQRKSLLAALGGDDASDLRGGLGVYYCPPDPTTPSESEEASPRFDANFSKRMERVSFPHQTTARRAALRAVVAALEYIRWEEEGFDKIVVGVAQSWIVRGITNDIHEWRNNGWRLNRQTVLGMPGDSVPDQDLWELLDRIVSDWEEIDCSIRFWQLSREELSPARLLAEAGALKEDQQAQIVKWTKKPRKFH